jgi:hypothetical protein
MTFPNNHDDSTGKQSGTSIEPPFSPPAWSLDDSTKRMMRLPFLTSTKSLDSRLTQNFDRATMFGLDVQEDTKLCPISKKPIATYAYNRPLADAIYYLFIKPQRTATSSASFFQEKQTAWTFSEWSKKPLKDPCLVWYSERWWSVDLEEVQDINYYYMLNPKLGEAITYANRLSKVSEPTNETIDTMGIDGLPFYF